MAVLPRRLSTAVMVWPLRACRRALSTRLDNLKLNKSMRCKAVIFDLQSLRMEAGEAANDPPPGAGGALNYLSSSRLSAPSEELKAELLDSMLSYELRDAARQRGLDSIGPREVVASRLRQHLADAEPPAPPAASAAEELGAAAAGVRNKYEGKLQALRAKASLKSRGGDGASPGAGGGGGWCVQRGATQLAQYLDNRGMARALLLRPSQGLLSSGPPPPTAEDVRRRLDAEARQLQEQISAPAFAAVGADASAAGLLELAARLDAQPQSTLLLSSSLELVSAARRSHMFTCYFKKRLGRDTGMRGTDPDYVVNSLEEAVHAFDELNGVSFRVIPWN